MAESTPSPARRLALQILLAVERGGYAADLLASRTAPLPPREAALCRQIVLGSLRFQLQLDWLILHLSGRHPDGMDPEVRAALRMGIYQLRYLDRIPPHAAVSQSVELVKRARKRSAAPLVNAILRRAGRAAVNFPDRTIELSHPAWMLERWERRYGADPATAIARANLRPPQTYVRLPDGVTAPAEATLEATELPGCFRLVRGRAAGLRVQDIGSQSILPLMELVPGLRFLDVCAAPGNKTAQALEAGVRAVACDLHFSRLRRMKGLDCALVVADGAAGLPFRRTFDRVLVDAPCSGTGTLARNPEIKWRLEPSKLFELHRLQVKLLANALDVLAPGGLLVYATCSLEPEENEDVVAEVLGRPPDCVLRRLPGRDPGDGFFAAVIRSR